MIKQMEQNVDQASLVQMINDMLAYPENYPQGAVYPLIRTLELLEEQQSAVAAPNLDYQKGIDDGAEYFLYTDGQGDTIEEVFLQMQRSATEIKSKEYWCGVALGMKSIQGE